MARLEAAEISDNYRYIETIMGDKELFHTVESRIKKLFNNNLADDFDFKKVPDLEVEVLDDFKIGGASIKEKAFILGFSIKVSFEVGAKFNFQGEKEKRDFVFSAYVVKSKKHQKRYDTRIKLISPLKIKPGEKTRQSAKTAGAVKEESLKNTFPSYGAKSDPYNKSE